MCAAIHLTVRPTTGSVFAVSTIETIWTRTDVVEAMRCTGTVVLTLSVDTAVDVTFQPIVAILTRAFVPWVGIRWLARSMIATRVT